MRSLAIRCGLRNSSGRSPLYPVKPPTFLIGLGALILTAVTFAGTEPRVLKEDPRVHLTFGEQRLVMAGGLQPSMLSTSAGTLVVQAQTTEKPHPAKRISYPSAIDTVVSRDGGKTWALFPRKPNDNGLNFEAGALQLRSGKIIALDTYVTPVVTPGAGMGQLYFSEDDWKTLQGPFDVPFRLPKVNFRGSSDDYGRFHEAARLHRRILELPNGDLLATLYGWYEGDTAMSTYMPTMRRARCMLVRSRDQGMSWELVSLITTDVKIGTEGFGEPVLARVSAGPHAGRLICLMRTGEDLYESRSEDNGVTWSAPRVQDFGVLDIHHTEKWAEMFHGVKDAHGQPVGLTGAVVDPELLELRSGLLVCAVGVRIPARASWPRASYPGNGDYLAVSLDGGDNWSHVVQFVSGVLTTHYTALVETNHDNQLFVAYDLGDWASGQGRSIYGRTVTLAVTPR